MCYYTEEEKKIIEEALNIIKKKGEQNPEEFTSPDFVRKFLSLNLSTLEREVFAVLFLDTKHRLIEYKILFSGTIDGASVYPREVVKYALNVNASSVIFAHNHPSGDTTPSTADKAITNRLKEALATVDIKTLDHFIVGFGKPLSFAERGLI